MRTNHVHGLITVVSVLAMSSALALASLAAGCATGVDGGVDGKRLPVAVLACPDHVEPGASFTLDGSGSSDDATIASVALTLEPGHLSATSLQADFHIDTPAIATARLVITDVDKNTAEARCRFAVGDPDADPPALPPPPDDPSAGDPSAGDPGAGDPGDDAGAPPPPSIDLTGKFALVAYDRPKLGGLVLYPATQCGAGPEVSLVDITQTGYHVSMTVTTCTIGLADVQIDVLGWQTVETSSMPDVVLRALPSVGPIDFDLDDADVGSRFAVPGELLRPQIVGADVTDPNGALPSDASDATVQDADSDGNPGVTIENTELDDGSTYDEYVVMRHSIRALAGTIQSADEIDGSDNGDWRADSDMTLLSPFSMFVPTGQGLPSTFKMTRVNTATTCDQVRADVAQYLASLPQPAPPADCPAY